MGIQVKGEKVKIFRNESNGRTLYNAGLSKKIVDGTYENGSMSIQFRKGEEIPDQAKINIKNGFMTFYKNKENHTVPQIFVMDYEFVEGQQSKPEPSAPVDDSFVPIDESDLPF